MKIILSYLGGVGEVEINTPTDDPDTNVKPDIKFNSDSGYDKALIESRFYSDIKNQSGFYGHLFDVNNTTNLDISHVVRSLDFFEVESIEPEIMAKPLPSGELT